MNTLSEADEESAKESVPLPSVCNTCPDVPSEVGKVIASLIVKEAGKKSISEENNHISAHKQFLKIPLIGNFILTSEIERFSSTMALIMESGTNLDTALDESAKVFNNKYLNSLIIDAKNDVIEGKDFIYSLNQTNIFPDIFIQLISSGYKSGNLIKMFHKSSSFLKNEIETKRSIFLSLLEPLVIIFMGGFIMLIVLAILIPIMQMNTLSLG